MTRNMAIHQNAQGDNVTVLDTEEGFKVWNQEHAVEIGTAQTEEDARNMIEG